MSMEQWYVNVLSDVSPDAPLAFDTVHGRDGAPLAYASGSAWAIPSGSPNPEAACRWARVMNSVDAWEAAGNARLEARSDDGKPFPGLLTATTHADALLPGMVPSDQSPGAPALPAISAAPH